MRHFLIHIILLICFAHTEAQVRKKEVPKTTRILFLLDASGSMLSKWEGQYRIDIAKRVLGEMVAELDNIPRLETALRVYGHQFPKEQQNCNDTKLEAAFAPNNSGMIKEELSKLRPKGTTPLAVSLEQAANDFPNDPNGRNIIIIITDGLESCGGDPCSISMALQKKHIFLKPFVIGVGLEKDYSKQFACLGKFVNASKPEEFKSILKEVIDITLKESFVKVELLNSQNQAKETNLPVRFINDFTGDAEVEFIHHLDATGKAEKVKVDPVLSYNLEIGTIPPVRVRDVDIKPGQENTIQVKSPTGTFKVLFKGHNAYKNLKAIVRKAGKDDILNVQDATESERYLIGKYDVEVLTVPPTIFNGVTIENKDNNTVSINAPGILSIIDGGNGFGIIYEIERSGKETIVCNIKNQGNYYLQPGIYKLIYRPANVMSQEFSVSKTFKITPQGSTKLRLY